MAAARSRQSLALAAARWQAAKSAAASIESAQRALVSSSKGVTLGQRGLNVHSRFLALAAEHDLDLDLDLVGVPNFDLDLVWVPNVRGPGLNMSSMTSSTSSWELV